jgi:hypothetical protein
MMGANMDKSSQNAQEKEPPEAFAMRFALEQTQGRPAAVRKALMPEMIFRK